MSSMETWFDFWFYWLTIGLTGPLLYYWFKAMDYLQRLKVARMLDSLGVEDIE
jgi:hypothetical protein